MKKRQKFFIYKEILDRIGYGFGNSQFVNILFYLIGAPFFLIGMVSGLRVLLISSYGTYIEEYSLIRPIKKQAVSFIGIVYGFSFILLSIAIYFQNIYLFISAILIASLSAVSHGNYYSKLYKFNIQKYNGLIIRKTTQFGIIILIISIFLSSLILEKFSIYGNMVNIFGYSLNLVGYFITFEITAIAFILSGYFISFAKEPEFKTQVNKILHKNVKIFSNIYQQIIVHSKHIFKNKVLFILLIASMLTGFAQTMSSTFYGIYIYRNFKYFGLGGFLNVGLILILSLLVSYLGTTFAKHLAKRWGSVPMLTFGTSLMAIMPLTYFKTPYLLQIGVSTVIGIIGASIVGLATGLLIADEISLKYRKVYFATFSALVTIPYLFLIPLGSWVAQVYGLKQMFFYMGLILIVFVIPLYFLILLFNRNKVL